MPIAGDIEFGFDSGYVNTYATPEMAERKARAIARRLETGLWKDTMFNVRIVASVGRKDGELVVRWTPVFACFRGGANPQQCAITIAQQGYAVYA